MRFLKFTFIILLISSLIGFPIYYFYFMPAATPLDQLYEVENPSKKDVKQIISAMGNLKLKDQVKIGSIVTGRGKSDLC